MPDSTPCAQCTSPNDPGSRFCQSCGASLTPQVHCPSCNTLNPLGNRFCMRCGSALEGAGWAGSPAVPGGVVEGVWERGPDEIIRRVDPEDARRFLGTRTVRVPAATVGVVLVDGVIDRVLPPGEQTTLGLFERVAAFFLRRPRTAFYLVDQRPLPVPFVVHARPGPSGRSVKTQVLVNFTLPKGNHQALASFIANVLGDRPAFTAGELYNLLRPEVVRIAEDALERAVAESPDGEIAYADVEAKIRAALAASVGPRYGLGVDATLEPLVTIASLSFHLGTGAAPATRPCAACGRELPASMRFCDACGARQTVATPAGPLDATTPLFSADGQQVELDLVVRVQGQHDDFGPERIAPALVGAAAAHLRAAAFAALAQPGGFGALETALRPATEEALASFGLTLVALTVVDARTKTGQWLLHARADLERAREDVKIGRAWLEQRDDELDLEELTLTQALRAKTVARDAQLRDSAAEVEDRERRAGLADREAKLARDKAQREGETQAAVAAVAEERQRREQAFATELKQNATAAELDIRRQHLDAELAGLRARRDLDFADVERRARLERELAATDEARQIEKLRAMAEIERQTAAQEQAHELEKRRMLQGLRPDEMIALQAAELAKSEGGGAAWANVLAQQAGAAEERRHAEEMRALLERQQAGNAALYQTAMGAMSDVARSRAEAAPVVGGAAAPVVTVANAAGSEPAAATRSCKACGAGLKAEAKFCGACGASQV
jgi:hypothetical protein